MDAPLYFEQDPELNKQRIRSLKALHALEKAKQAVAKSGREWVWSTEGGVRCLRSENAKPLFDAPGLRLETIQEIKNRNKSQALANLTEAQLGYDEAVLANRMMGLGSAPSWVIKVLQALHTYNVMQYFRVIGTHSLYAYESAANVAFHSEQTATQDIDLLWYMQRRLKFVQHLGALRPPMSMIDVLQKADKTFVRHDTDLESAINDEAYAVDFLRVANQPKDLDAYPISSLEGDVMPVQAIGADRLMQGPIFEQPVICVSTGQMCMMPTVDPVIFASFKQQMSTNNTRDPRKRSRDATQSSAVVGLLNAGLLKTGLTTNELRGFKVDGMNLPNQT